jgi:tetratricopeptide (TPR) repeat protein
VLHTCLGNNYKTLGKNTEAEQAYLHAWYMAPARFYPLYLLAKLYDETGQTEKAVAMAKKLLEKEVKIESTAIQEIQEEMRKIIEKGDAGTLNESHIQTDKNLTPIYKETKEEAYRSVVLTDKFMLQKW